MGYHSNKETQIYSNRGGNNNTPLPKIDICHKILVEKKRRHFVGQAEAQNWE